jgi:hypothetical protein
MKRLLAVLVLATVAALLSIVPAEAGDEAVAVVWSEPARVYASFDASPFALLAREPVTWNSSTGFQIPERAHAVGWLTLIYAERIEYMQVVRGVETGSVYLIVTESLREFVADYGGESAWHTRGMFRVSGAAWDGAVTAIKQANGVTL